VTTATDQQVASFRSQGWVRLPGALPTDTVVSLAGWAADLQAWSERGEPGLHHFEATDAGPVVARTERFADDHAALRAFVTSGVLTDVLAALLGEPVTLFKEKLNYKQPGGAGFAPHQDATAYRFVDHHLSVMVPIDPSTVRSGCLYFAPGHRDGLMPSDGRGRIARDHVETLAWEPIEAEPGDLVVFDSYAPHYSDTNHTDRPRRALYLTYNAAARGDFRSAYYEDKAAEFGREGRTFDDQRVRMSINDDFLGRPVEAPR
jgi:hypothetical protein